MINKIKSSVMYASCAAVFLIGVYLIAPLVYVIGLFCLGAWLMSLALQSGPGRFVLTRIAAYLLNK